MNKIIKKVSEFKPFATIRTKTIAFSHVFYRSVTSARYYRHIYKTKPSFTIKYFISLTILASLTIGVVSSAKQSPEIINLIKEVFTNARNIFPDDLVIETKADNTWTTNKEEPVILPFPAGLADKMNQQITDESEKLPTNLIALYKNGVVDDLAKLDVLVLINNKNIITKEADQTITKPLENLKDKRIDKATYLEMLDSATKWATAVIPPLIAGKDFTTAAIQLIIIQMPFYIIIGIAFWLLTKIFKQTFTFADSIRTAFHAATIPIIIFVLQVIIGQFFGFSLWFEIINLLVTIYVFVVLKNTSQTDTESHILSGNNSGKTATK